MKNNGHRRPARLVTGDLGPTQIALGGDSTYVLDAEGGRVLRVPIAGGAAETVLEQGQAVNLANVGRPVEVVVGRDAESCSRR